MRYACKNCETLFDASGRPSGLTSALLSTVVLGLFAAIATANGKPIAVWVVMGLIALRWWFYARSSRAMCPSCQSRDCVSTETPAGRKIVASAPPPVVDRIDFKASSPEEQAILDEERRARAAFNRR